MLKVLVIADHRCERLPAIRVFEHMISSKNPADVQCLTFTNNEVKAQDGGLFCLDWDIAERAAIMGCTLMCGHDVIVSARKRNPVPGIIDFAAGGACLIIVPRGETIATADKRCQHMARAVMDFNKRKNKQPLRVAVVATT